MLKSRLSSLALACGISIFAPLAHAEQIDFENKYTTSWEDISASYGSIAGLLEVSYFDAQRNLTTLRYWQGGYSGSSAAFAGIAESGSIGQITLTPVAGYAVTLNSFFLGSYSNSTRNSSYRIDDLSTGNLDISSGPVVVAANGLTVTPNLTSSSGIVISFGPDAYNVGINHINFTVTAVPEPESYAMLLAGLGLVSLVARNRRQRPIA